MSIGIGKIISSIIPSFSGEKTVNAGKEEEKSIGDRFESSPKDDKQQKADDLKKFAMESKKQEKPSTPESTEKAEKKEDSKSKGFSLGDLLCEVGEMFVDALDATSTASMCGSPEAAPLFAVAKASEDEDERDMLGTVAAFQTNNPAAYFMSKL